MTVQITDHGDRAKARLAGQDQDQTNTLAMLSAYVAQGQIAEDTLWQLFSERRIDTAIGQQLDDIGKIVGELRNGLVDADYRRILQARIATNNSDGTTADLIRVIVSVINDTAQLVTVQTLSPASVNVVVSGPNATASATADIAIRMLRDAVSAGILPTFISSENADDDTLTCGTCAFLNGTHLISSTTLTLDRDVGSDAVWPATGSLIVSQGMSNEETVTYSAKVGSTFTVSALAFAHSGSDAVTLVESGVNKGLGDNTVSTTGGHFASALR